MEKTKKTCVFANRWDDSRLLIDWHEYDTMMLIKISSYSSDKHTCTRLINQIINKWIMNEHVDDDDYHQKLIG